MYGLSKEWAINFSAIFFSCGVRQGMVFIREATHLMLQTVHYKAFRMIGCATMIWFFYQILCCAMIAWVLV